MCRDEFNPISDAIFSDDFQIELQKTNGLFTEKFCKEMFDSCFKRSFNVEYIFNTDMQEFKQKMKHGQDSKKPIMFILWKEMFMSVYIQEFHNALRDLDNLFDVYFCDDDQFASQFFNTKMMPLELPHIYIIEPNQKKEVIPRDGQSKPLTEENNNFYPKKYQNFIFNISTPSIEF